MYKAQGCNHLLIMDYEGDRYENRAKSFFFKKKLKEQIIEFKACNSIQTRRTSSELREHFVKPFKHDPREEGK